MSEELIKRLREALQYCTDHDMYPLLEEAASALESRPAPAVQVAADGYRDMLEIIVKNAELSPDASMNGSTECYAVPLDDIENARALLAFPAGVIKWEAGSEALALLDELGDEIGGEELRDLMGSEWYARAVNALAASSAPATAATEVVAQDDAARAQRVELLAELEKIVEGIQSHHLDHGMHEGPYVNLVPTRALIAKVKEAIK